MPQYITQIEADGSLNTALASFAQTCAANAGPLGLDPSEVIEINNAANNFDTHLLDWQNARNAAKNALTRKDGQKEASRGVVSKFAKRFRANPAVSDPLLASLMLPPHETPGTRTEPTTPAHLVASGDGNGLVSLRWGRNGNTQATVFQVWYRTSPTGEWAALGSTTKTRFEHQWSPGEYVGYRVTASRNSFTSPPSTPVVLWEPAGKGALLLAA
ncbi:MAG: hypothetical protein AB7F50_05840 [Fimbriimonadaceae bacterium]